MIPKIEIDGKSISIEPKLVRVEDLCVEAKVQINSPLFLLHESGARISLEKEDFLIVRNGLKIASDNVKRDRVDDNESVHCSVSCTLNKKKIRRTKNIKVLGKELREKDKDLHSSKLYAAIEGASIDVAVEDDFRIVLQGGEEFLTIPIEAENEGIVDVEKCAKSRRCPPKGYKYRIKIGSEYREVEKSKMTGEEILVLVGKTSGEYVLNQKFPGGRREKIEATAVISLVDVCVERFGIRKKSVTQGQTVG